MLRTQVYERELTHKNYLTSIEYKIKPLWEATFFLFGKRIFSLLSLVPQQLLLSWPVEQTRALAGEEEKEGGRRGGREGGPFNGR